MHGKQKKMTRDRGDGSCERSQLLRYLDNASCSRKKFRIESATRLAIYARVTVTGAGGRKG
jgi:hypothetical protein